MPCVLLATSEELFYEGLLSQYFKLLHIFFLTLILYPLFSDMYKLHRLRSESISYSY